MKAIRQTIQKDLVKETVFASCDHPTAEQIYNTIVLTHPSISKATVYRNLNLLVDDGLVKRVQVLGGPDHFDKTVLDHYHIQCTCCKRVEDVEGIPNLGILAGITNAKGYRIDSYEIVFSGVCPDCLEKNAAMKQ
ncbi:Fe2+/Zn2+ uptake regulation protein [Sphaerochaeta pleomorpha str. Grapes]|uniref:Fe2+/Zn2+ uptake regulation protein n=1 Tax=Sphaerochaeta pleomorpha (strain ATCC BAA-1885 / DSM 22778 / Grapes) TaxID=158190 RepID=G8QYE1_SPHPG|nr:transcriptional repressor [Sphaerochaeta pleomorpha]AEV30788.1 Fe2+/Zn2+ uptake regulation protein [Sphaerochaeta pleomorpha str. Grapes]